MRRALGQPRSLSIQVLTIRWGRGGGVNKGSSAQTIENEVPVFKGSAAGLWHFGICRAFRGFAFPRTEFFYLTMLL